MPGAGRRGPHRVPALLGLGLALSACGGMPRVEAPTEAFSSLGYDWRRHFEYGIEMLEGPRLQHHKTVFMRAAFASAARFSRDHAPSYAGLGFAELNLGNFSAAQLAFMNAALIEDRSLYWALSTLAALRGDNERVARASFDAMQAAVRQDDDPASRFIRAVYLSEDRTYRTAMSVIPHSTGTEDVDEALVCNADNHNEEPLCRNLNIVASVYFVRRYSSDTTARGSGIFNDLIVQLGAAEGDSYYQYERNRTDEGVTTSRQLVLQPQLTIPDIQYAVRLMPTNIRNSLYLNAAPSVVTSIGEESEIREGSDLTILYSGTDGDAAEYTAKTGTMLNMQPESASSEFVKLKLEFEISSVAALEPAQNAQVLNVSTNKYTVAGHFPYGRPVVLGTLSNGSQKYDSAGQIGLRRIPGVGGGFGKSNEEVSSSDTLVIGVLSEPSVFRGSHEKRVLDAMRSLGVQVQEPEVITRRKIVHHAPDVASFMPAFLKQQREAFP